jgi:hypothetical protein
MKKIPVVLSARHQGHNPYPARTSGADKTSQMVTGAAVSGRLVSNPHARMTQKSSARHTAPAAVRNRDRKFPLITPKRGSCQPPVVRLAHSRDTKKAALRC